MMKMTIMMMTLMKIITPQEVCFLISYDLYQFLFLLFLVKKSGMQKKNHCSCVLMLLIDLLPCWFDFQELNLKYQKVEHQEKERI